uniref:Uncharacterized protein n=1 Tax=Micrurus spixii TaxID=129469 RepID=A0A2D4LKQ1_9SAUR
MKICTAKELKTGLTKAYYYILIFFKCFLVQTIKQKANHVNIKFKSQNAVFIQTFSKLLIQITIFLKFIHLKYRCKNQDINDTSLASGTNAVNVLHTKAPT